MNIFLSTSFSCKVDDAGVIQSEFKALVQERLAQLRAAGHEVFCVIEDRDWRMEPGENKGEQVAFDIGKIRESEAIVAIIGEKISAGLQWELGFMTGLGRPVYLWPEHDAVELPYWDQGLIENGDITLVSSAEEVK